MLSDYFYWHFFYIPAKLFTAWRNLGFFSFYYFGIIPHLKSIFTPWKRQVFVKRSRGIDSGEIISFIIINTFSSLIGFTLKSSVIFSGLAFGIFTFFFGWIPLLLWISLLFLTFPLYLTSFFRKNNQRKNIIRFYYEDPQKTVNHLQNEKGMVSILEKLEIYPNVFYAACRKISQWATLPENKGGMEKEMHFPEFLEFFCGKNEDILNLIEASGIKLNHIKICAKWYEYSLNPLDPLILDKERINKIPFIGHDWNYGFTPVFDEFTENLTYSHTPYPVLIGRDKEIRLLESILSKATSQNALITGEAGVARHAIVDNLAKRINAGLINAKLAFKRVLKIDMHKIISSFPSLNESKGFFASLIKEANSAGNIILVIDEIERYASKEQGNIDWSDIFSEYANEPVSFIGITTDYAYKRYLTGNQDITANFEKVTVLETDEETALIEILFSVTPFLEKKYKVNISLKAALSCVRNSAVVNPSLPLPARAIEILEGASSTFAHENNTVMIRDNNIADYIAQKYHTPVGKTDDNERYILANLENLLSQRLINQKQAVSAIANAIRRVRLGMKDPKKPVGTFLFLGPTGVGKTQCAKVLAEKYYGSENKLIRLDMSQYNNPQATERLIGSAKEGIPGDLVSLIRDNPFTVLLLDEFEKSHREVYNIFLPLLDEGYIFDPNGKRVHANNCIIIATTNAGSRFIAENFRKIPQNEFSVKLTEHLIEYGVFSPELLNRFDEVVCFEPLSEGNLREVAKLMLEDFNRLIRDKGIKIRITDRLIRSLTAKAAFSPFGAREIKRVISKEIEEKISRVLLNKPNFSGDIEIDI